MCKAELFMVQFKQLAPKGPHIKSLLKLAGGKSPNTQLPKFDKWKRRPYWCYIAYS